MKADKEQKVLAVFQEEEIACMSPKSREWRIQKNVMVLGLAKTASRDRKFRATVV